MKKYSMKYKALYVVYTFCFAIPLFPPSSLASSGYIVPEPQEFSLGEGVFPLQPDQTRIEFPRGNLKRFSVEVGQIEQEYQKITGAAPRLTDEKAKLTIRLILSRKNKTISPEGYHLSINPKEVKITAATKTGLFYGVQTLKQIMRAHAKLGALPALTITDWPALPFRGVMDDISRGPVPTVNYMRYQVKRLSELKFNRLSYYSEHIIKTKSHPEFAPADGAISIQEWKDLASFAKKYHIQLVGNFQSFGHFEKILSHSKYRPLGEADSMISPVLPQSKEFLSDILNEVVPAFDAPYFNVNSDETFDLGSDYSKLSVEKYGKGKIYTDHIRWLHQQLKKHDVRMMMWADIIARHPEAIKDIPKDTLMLPWNYDADADFTGMIKSLKAANHDVIVTPGILNSYRIMPDFELTRQNLHKFIGAGVKENTLGSWTTVWDDGVMALFSHDWYGLAFAADQNWHPGEDIQKADFEKRLLNGVYGTENSSFIKALDQLAMLALLKPTDGYRDRVLWQKTLPERGQTSRVDLSGWPEVMAISRKAQQLLKASPLLYYPEDAEIFAYTASLFETLAKSRIWLYEAAIKYDSATRKQIDAPLLARSDLTQSLAKISSIAASWRLLHDFYETLWLKENRSYSLDNVLDKFTTHISAWQDTHRRTKSALRDFDMGQVLPAPANVRLDIKTLSGEYLGGWLEIGDFPVNQIQKALDYDFLAEGSSEKNSRPKTTQTIIAKAHSYRWHRISSNTPDIVDLLQHNPNARNQAALYEFAELTSPDKRQVKAKIGSTGSIKVILNGHEVYSHNGEREMLIDEDSIILPLKAGKNYIMLKTIRNGGEWQFSFNLPDSRISGHKNRYTILH